MSIVHYDSRCTDDERRAALYRGDIFVYSPLPAAQRLAELARGMVEEAFAPHDPRRIDKALSMEECAAVLAEPQPAFIRHPECKVLPPEIIRGIGGDAEQVHFDVPRPRSAYPTDYLTSGIACAFHAHRDTWYSAAFCQVNGGSRSTTSRSGTAWPSTRSISTPPSRTAPRSTTTTSGAPRTGPARRST